MYLKVKVEGENGRWRLFECEEVEWNTTRKEIDFDSLRLPEDSQNRCYLDKTKPHFLCEIWLRKKGSDNDIKMYCNTQAYILNDEGETLETIIQQFRTVYEKSENKTNKKVIENE